MAPKGMPPSERPSSSLDEETRIFPSSASPKSVKIRYRWTWTPWLYSCR
jgi:hypothetical protein